MSGYIPAEDTLALAWMVNFASKLTTQFALYGVTPSDALAVTNAVNQFDAALQLTLDPATKTTVTVANKDQARAAAEAICRQYAMAIKVSAGVSDGDKIAIGVRPQNDQRDPIPAPDTSPMLNVVAATPLSHTLRYSDSMTPDSGRKPEGAISLQLFVAVGTEAATEEGAGNFYGNFTKNPVLVAFDPADDGKVASYSSRWQSRRGEVGPWSAPISFRIAA
jgi:hypothetical protein